MPAKLRAAARTARARFVREGRADEVLDYIDAVDAGIHA